MTLEQAAMALHENTTDFSKFINMKDIKYQVPVRSEGIKHAWQFVSFFFFVIFITVHID